MLGNNLANVIAYPLCMCGHRHDHHRHHVPEGCHQCKECGGYQPSDGAMFDSLFAELPAGSTLGPNLTERDLDARLEGFADAEGLVLAMLDDMVAREWVKHGEAVKRWESATGPLAKTTWTVQAIKRRDRAQVLEEAELALRMGQHRDAKHGDPDLGRKLERAHQKMANGAGKGRRGGEKTSGGLTKDERVKKAKLAAEARWGKRSKE